MPPRFPRSHVPIVLRGSRENHCHSFIDSLLCACAFLAVLVPWSKDVWWVKSYFRGKMRNTVMQRSYCRGIKASFQREEILSLSPNEAGSLGVERTGGLAGQEAVWLGLVRGQGVEALKGGLETLFREGWQTLAHRQSGPAADSTCLWIKVLFLYLYGWVVIERTVWCENNMQVKCRCHRWGYWSTAVHAPSYTSRWLLLAGVARPGERPHHPLPFVSVQ